MLGVNGRSALTALSIALWLGAVIFFVAVVAPAAFRTLPTRTLAGALVGGTLPALFISGIVLGGLVVLLATGAGVPRRVLRLTVGGAIVVLCGLGQFVIGARIGRIRGQLTTTLESLGTGDPVRAEFGRLHGMSVGTLGAAAVVAATLLILLLLSPASTGTSDEL